MRLIHSISSLGAIHLFLMAIPLCHALVADPPIPKVDVAIIGGGLSGLSTAKGLAAANKSFAILEA